jgi:hypothetical protein
LELPVPKSRITDRDAYGQDKAAHFKKVQVSGKTEDQNSGYVSQENYHECIQRVILCRAFDEIPAMPPDILRMRFECGYGVLRR